MNINGNVSWGDACVATLKAYKEDQGVPTPFDDKKTANITENIFCHENNDAGMPKVTGTINCGLKPLYNGMFQWTNISKITCKDPVTAVSYAGALAVENCTWTTNTVPASW